MKNYELKYLPRVFPHFLGFSMALLSHLVLKTSLVRRKTNLLDTNRSIRIKEHTKLIFVSALKNFISIFISIFVSNYDSIPKCIYENFCIRAMIFVFKILIFEFLYRFWYANIERFRVHGNEAT